MPVATVLCQPLGVSEFKFLTDKNIHIFEYKVGCNSLLFSPKFS
jgi:hypothetical protein